MNSGIYYQLIQSILNRNKIQTVSTKYYPEVGDVWLIEDLDNYMESTLTVYRDGEKLLCFYIRAVYGFKVPETDQKVSCHVLTEQDIGM